LNKQGLSLIEVLISVMLISVVIVAILQIKENNLYFLDKTQQSSKFNSYIYLLSLDNSKNLRDTNIYLSDKFDFKDDDIRKELKQIKINIKDEELDTIELVNEEYSLDINIKQTNISIDKESKHQFYRFALNDK